MPTCICVLKFTKSQFSCLTGDDVYHRRKVVRKNLTNDDFILHLNSLFNLLQDDKSLHISELKAVAENKLGKT